MGMRWRAVLVKASDSEAQEIATSAQQIIPSLRNQIDASIVSLRSPNVPAPWLVLRMFNFLDRAPECIDAPPFIGEAFSAPAFQSVPGSDSLMAIAKEPHVALAILASRMRSDATFVICSDTSCCSGYLRFNHGMIASGEIYGWGGNDELWKFSPNSFNSQQIEFTDPDSYNYYIPVADGLIATIGPGADEIFLSPTGGGDDGEWLRYHILTKRQLISPVVAKPEFAEQPSATPVAKPSNKIRSSQIPKRPWWKFW